MKRVHTLEIEGRDRDLQIDALRIMSEDVTASDDGGTTPEVEESSEPESETSSTPDPVAPARPTTGDNYEALLNNVVGFAQGVTGGKGGELCRVTRLSDSGDGSLRDCATKGNTWVVFDVSGEIALRSPLRIANDTTIDGRGADITITNRGLSTAGRENIVIHNLKIDDINGDGIAVYDAKDIWIDHVSVSDTSDGAIDITKQSRNVTVSWSHLTNQNKTMLISANNSHTEDEIITVTLHHNWYEGTMRRNPLIRFGSLHMYNNVLSNWGTSGGGDGVNSVYGARVLLENNVFEAGANTMAVRTTVPNYMEVPGYIKARGNLARNGARVFSAEPERVFEASDLYEYRLAVANNSLASAVKTYAGWQPASFFSSGQFAAEAGARNADGNHSGVPAPVVSEPAATPESVVSEPTTEHETAPTVVSQPRSAVTRDAFVIEAESGVLTEPMERRDNYIFTNKDGEGTATYSFEVTEAGEYRFEVKARARRTNADSLYISVNQEPETTLHIYERDEQGGFYWKENDPYVVRLAAGTHTLTLRGREDDTFIDAVRIMPLQRELGSMTREQMLELVRELIRRIEQQRN